MLLQTAEQSIVNLDKVYEISVRISLHHDTAEVIAIHHPGDETPAVLYEGWIRADCQDYYNWLMNAIETAHPEARIIRDALDHPSTKEEAIARAAATDSES